MNKEDFYYTTEDLAKLKARSNDDRICRVAYNLYKIHKGDYLKELYAELMITLKTEIIDKLKYGTLKSGLEKEDDDDDVKKIKAFTNAYIGLVKSLPAIAKGFKTLENHIGIINNTPETEDMTNKTAEQMLREKINKKDGVLR
jgi:hypothetical protein